MEIGLEIVGESGRLLDAAIEIEPMASGCAIIMHANGGASRGRPAQNPDYILALETLLIRLQRMDALLDGLWVDSKPVAHLPLDEREVRPGGRSFPIRLRAIEDIALFRLEIRRAVSRTGGRTIESVGTGNKRIRMQISVAPRLLQTMKRNLLGELPTPSTGCWFELTKELHEVSRRKVQIPKGVRLLPGHLVARIMQWEREYSRAYFNRSGSLPRCDIWYVNRVISQASPSGDSQIAPKIATLTRITKTTQLERDLLIGSDVFDGIGEDNDERWIAIEQTKLAILVELLGTSLEDLRIPVPTLKKANQQQRAAISRLVSSAAPVVQERLSKYVERGRAGSVVKAANGYRCQICEALGLPALGFRKLDGTPFVEAHHVIPVSSLEADVLGSANVISVCPNHHRQLHFGGVVQLDEGHCFRFDFPFNQPTVRIRKFVNPV